MIAQIVGIRDINDNSVISNNDNESEWYLFKIIIEHVLLYFKIKIIQDREEEQSPHR